MPERWRPRAEARLNLLSVLIEKRLQAASGLAMRAASAGERDRDACLRTIDRVLTSVKAMQQERRRLLAALFASGRDRS